MDYKTNYTNTYNQIFLERSIFFKDQIVLAKQLKQTFNYTSNSLLKKSNEFLTSKLGFHFSVFDIRVIDNFPKSSSGKTLYSKLPY